MSVRRHDFERIRSLVEQADAEEPLTAREIYRLLEEKGEDIDSAHRVATVLGRHARSGEVEVIEDQPYRYRFVEDRNS